MIDPRNFGDVKKIRFSRASRTDKKVHALLNYFCAKLHVDQAKGYEYYKRELNKACPDDMRVFSLIEANKGFDARSCTSFREYDYYIPSFCLQNEIKAEYKVVGDRPKITEHGFVPPYNKDQIEVSKEGLQ